MGNDLTMPLYENRSSEEKLRASWHKCSKLMERGDWSSAIMRAATATELAMNIAIRHELQTTLGLELGFVNSLLKWANGIQGKLDKLLKPMHAADDWRAMMNLLGPEMKFVNDRRTEIVHKGHFMNETEAQDAVTHAKNFINILLRKRYDSNFDLDQFMANYRISDPQSEDLSEPFIPSETTEQDEAEFGSNI
jgi:hypothetical protein